MMTTIHRNRTPMNFSKLPLAFCNGLTLKKDAYWNRHPILQAGTTINNTIIDFYIDVAMNIPVSIKLDKSTNKLEDHVLANMAQYKANNTNRKDLSITLDKGEVIMEEGDTSNKDCYILISGAVRVLIGGVQVATINEPGMPIGEMSFLSNEPRSATVITTEEVKILRLLKQQKGKILRSNPTISMTILEALVERLADNNKKMVTMQNNANTSSNQAIIKTQQLNKSYNTIVKALMKEAGFKAGNLEILEKMLQVLEKNLNNKLQSGDTAIVYAMFLDFVNYYRKQNINKNVQHIIMKENMSKSMLNLFQ